VTIRSGDDGNQCGQAHQGWRYPVCGHRHLHACRYCFKADPCAQGGRFFETGGIDPALDELPMAVADSRVMYGTSVNSGLIDAFSIVATESSVPSPFSGPPRVDKFGNLNSTVIGDYKRPKVRFPGSGGGLWTLPPWLRA